MEEITTGPEGWNTYANDSQVSAQWLNRRADFARLYGAANDVSLQKRVDGAAKTYIDLLGQISQSKLEDGDTPFFVPLSKPSVEEILNRMDNRFAQLNGSSRGQRTEYSRRRAGWKADRGVNSHITALWAGFDKMRACAKKHDVSDLWDMREAGFRGLYAQTNDVDLRARVIKTAEGYVELLSRLPVEEIDGDDSPFLVPLTPELDVEKTLERMDARIKELEGQEKKEVSEAGWLSKINWKTVVIGAALLVGVGVIAYNFEAIRASVTHGHPVSGGHAGDGPKTPIHHNPIHTKPPVNNGPPVTHSTGSGNGFGLHGGSWSFG